MRLHPDFHIPKDEQWFHAQHAPMGASLSFTCGHAGSRGGLGVHLGKPAEQDVYVGVKDGAADGREALRCLPFFVKPEASAQASFLVEHAAADNQAPDPDTMASVELTEIDRATVSRSMGWGTDRWESGDFSFAIRTPFCEIPEPTGAAVAEASDAMKRAVLPAVWAEVSLDNSAGAKTRTIVFGLGVRDGGVRVLEEGVSPQQVGFAYQQVGFLAEGRVARGGSEAAVRPIAVLRWSPHQGLAGRNRVHLLGDTPCAALEVPAGAVGTLRVALGCYVPGEVTTRRAGQYVYTKVYRSLEHVLTTALYRMDEWGIAAAEALDRRLGAATISPAQKFLIAHATRSYYGSTQLLTIAGEPWWIVNEGEYRMMNTLDLSVDQMFWELGLNPWAVRNVLDRFVEHYSYRDGLRDRATGRSAAGGISFTHDMGVANQFSPTGHSSYELPELDGCFSYMTQEQLCNWILMAATYVASTGDRAWAVRHAATIGACQDSMCARDHDDASQRNGVMSFETDRCGKGQEITTYDSIDPSLGQARASLYLAVKCWASYLGLRVLLDDVAAERVREAVEGARRAARTIAGEVRADGMLPAVFERESSAYRTNVLVAAEALVYPWSWMQTAMGRAASAADGGWLDARGPFGELIGAISRHMTLALDPRVDRGLRFADGGLRLSSSSDNSWMSKMAIVQHVLRRVLGSKADDATLAAADRAHASWQRKGESARWAMSDQMVRGVARGSRYYPRVITTALWLEP